MRCFFGYHDWTPALTDEQMWQLGIRRRICRRCAAIREYKWPYGPADLKEGEMSGMSMEEKAADHYHHRLKLAQERIAELEEALREIAEFDAKAELPRVTSVVPGSSPVQDEPSQGALARQYGFGLGYVIGRARQALKGER